MSTFQLSTQNKIKSNLSLVYAQTRPRLSVDCLFTQPFHFAVCQGDAMFRSKSASFFNSKSVWTATLSIAQRANTTILYLLTATTVFFRPEHLALKNNDGDMIFSFPEHSFFRGPRPAYLLTAAVGGSFYYHTVVLDMASK